MLTSRQKLLAAIPLLGTCTKSFSDLGVNPQRRLVEDLAYTMHMRRQGQDSDYQH